MLNYQRFKKWCLAAITCITATAYASPGGWLSLTVVNRTQSTIVAQLSSEQSHVAEAQPTTPQTIAPGGNVTFKAMGMGPTSCPRGCPDETYRIKYYSAQTPTIVNTIFYDFTYTDNGVGNWTMLVAQDQMNNYSTIMATCHATQPQQTNDTRCDAQFSGSDWRGYNFQISGHQVDNSATVYIIR